MFAVANIAPEKSDLSAGADAKDTSESGFPDQGQNFPDRPI